MRREAEKEGNKIKMQNAKLRSKAIFGKSIKNPMNKVEVKIVITRKQYFKWSFRPAFKLKKLFRNGAIAIEKEKFRVNLNKSIYIGTSILDLSTVLMLDLHYNFIRNEYGDKVELLLTDTDTIVLCTKLKLKGFMKP